ncbi:class I SAM-dependent methyltransferase [Elioraea sp.]|uniref:class I SAM-dependent methyltransferase n=1 Tax=Elioraea sp. TaxID=2185103 RepID=UPI0025BE27A8|nr:class I SAM-dependent methyltransferase [Elioraea sp.]
MPILINDENSVFAIDDYRSAGAYQGVSYGEASDPHGGLRGRYRRAVHRLAEYEISRRTLDVERALHDFCAARAERPRVLVIGAGNCRYQDAAEFHYTDVAFSDGVNAIADAHDLPFADGTFDFVIAIAVLEHVADPARVVGEVWRVLKPDGRVFAETPFLQPVHMGAYDFTRFTPLGHQRLFRRFSEIESGIARGPAAASAWSLKMVLSNLHPSRRFRSVMSLVALLLSIPIKQLDRMLVRNAGSLDGAGGVFFYGARQERTIPDREIITLYRGGF